MSPETVGDVVAEAMKSGNYPALRGLLMEHAKMHGAMTTALRLLEKIDDHRLCAIIRELASDGDEDIRRLAHASVAWKDAYLKMLEDGLDAKVG